jgi:hypothetical protein
LIEAIWMIRPHLRARMPSMTGRVTLKQELRLVQMTFGPLLRRHLVERRIAGDAGVVDEDLDRTQLAFDLADHLFGAFGGRTSPDARATSMPSRRSSSCHACAFSAFRKLVATRCPARASRLQIAVPIPPVPPVTSATLGVMRVSPWPATHAGDGLDLSLGRDCDTRVVQCNAARRYVGNLERGECRLASASAGVWQCASTLASWPSARQQTRRAGRGFAPSIGSADKDFESFRPSSSTIRGRVRVVRRREPERALQIDLGVAWNRAGLRRAPRR